MGINAFLTGSRAYGTPREDSDVDLVVRMDSEEADRLCDALQDGPSLIYDTMAVIPLRIGPLNLLIVTDAAYFEAWRDGTVALVARKPVTREEAVAELSARFLEIERARIPGATIAADAYDINFSY